ncbi:MAG TPA: hypothetical protein VFY45_02050 [Baekduia sp.]|nr:hypothetical protein [Baekduia sp.]
MRAGRAVVLAVLVCAAAQPAWATPHFIVGTGQNPGVAVDAAGTAYIGWKVNVYADQGDAVQLCGLPAGARRCATLATIPFPGAGYNLGRVSVLLPGAPGVVQVTVGRDLGPRYSQYVATSGDGGVTFGAPVAFGSGFGIENDVLPDGRIVSDGNGAGNLSGAAYAPNGSQAAIDRTSLDDRGQFPDIAVQGADAYIAGSAAGPSAVVRLPAGANWADPAAWQHLPDVNGEQPELAPGPLGPVALLEPPPFSKRGELFAQRWTGARWTAPVDVGGASYNSSFALAGSGTRLTGIWAVNRPGSPYVLDMVTSADGGTLWSSEATIATSPTALYTLELATDPAGHGIAVNGGDTSARPIWAYVIDPRRANVARTRFGDTMVQLRTDLGDCISEQRVRLRVQAARGGDLVSPSGVLRSARVSVRRSRILHRSRWSTLVDLRRARAKRTATLRLVPRHGRARTLRLVVRGCRRIA